MDRYDKHIAELKAKVKVCQCGATTKVKIWNTGFWNISCPVCHRIVSQVYLANAVKAWNRL